MQEYYVEWEAVAAHGTPIGGYRQNIRAESLAAAMAQFEADHGDLGPDDDGVCLVIRCISWQPAQED